MEKKRTKNQSETEKLGETLAKTLRNGDLIALYGELGAGKTAFVRGALRGLGFSGAVASPTFAIVNEYRNESRVAAHFDMYRIDTEEQLYTSGFYDYLGDAVIFAEWGDKVREFLPERRIDVTITQLSDGSREITTEDKR